MFLAACSYRGPEFCCSINLSHETFDMIKRRSIDTDIHATLVIILGKIDPTGDTYLFTLAVFEVREQIVCGKNSSTGTRQSYIT